MTTFRHEHRNTQEQSAAESQLLHRCWEQRGAKCLVAAGQDDDSGGSMINEAAGDLRSEAGTSNTGSSSSKLDMGTRRVDSTDSRSVPLGSCAIYLELVFLVLFLTVQLR